MARVRMLPQLIIVGACIAVTGADFLQVGRSDWPQWGGRIGRNNTPDATGIPSDWDVGEFDHRTGQLKRETSRNIKWVAQLGTQTYGTPVVANGQVYIGTNNGAGWLLRYPDTIDLGCLLAFKESDGSFLWQHSSEKLPTGRVHDWPMQGIVSVPLVDGDRLWYVTSRGEVVCLDTQGFRDGENDGPFRGEGDVAADEADIVWKFDMRAELGSRQHNMCTCSVTSSGRLLFVNTSNGVDESHINLPAPDAASFVAMDRITGKVLWTDNSPGHNILDGQWSSPTYAVFGGQPQVLFPGGDGWLYSFAPEGDGAGKSKLLWEFDCNPKDATWRVGGRGTRNYHITLPVVYQGKVYVAVGQNAEHGEGIGRLWCVDPLRKLDGSDVSIMVAHDAQGKAMPHRRFGRRRLAGGEFIGPNPDTAAVWEYTGTDSNGNGRVDFEEQMHRSCGHVAIKDNLLYIADFSGIVHCVDATTGRPHWTHDLFAATWASSPLIVDSKVFVADEDGDIAILRHSARYEPLAEINMGNAVYASPVVANNVLYIANKTHLFAIQVDGEK